MRGDEQSYLDKVKRFSLVFFSVPIQQLLPENYLFLSSCLSWVFVLQNLDFIYRSHSTLRYLFVTILRWCISFPKDICILMGPHTHVLKSLLRQGVRAAGHKMAAYHQVHNVLQKYNGIQDSRYVPCLTRQGKKNSNLWSPSDVYWEPWRSLYEPDHGITSLLALFVWGHH